MEWPLSDNTLVVVELLSQTSLQTTNTEQNKCL
jgi:hypothetical protein